MAWQTPKTNWQAADVVSKDDFNRIEGNIQHLQDTKETPAGAQAKAEATAGAVQAELDAHKTENASTSQKGHVQLSTSTTSTSTSLAATASAVKTVNDALTSHLLDDMPHQTTDTSTSKTYTYGIAMQNGVVGILMEEVV
jgi:uncharacterized protein YdaU (DUF1376 family)